MLLAAYSSFGMLYFKVNANFYWCHFPVMHFAVMQFESRLHVGAHENNAAILSGIVLALNHVVDKRRCLPLEC